MIYLKCNNNFADNNNFNLFSLISIKYLIVIYYCHYCHYSIYPSYSTLSLYLSIIIYKEYYIYISPVYFSNLCHSIYITWHDVL